MIELRDYQQECVTRVLDAYKKDSAGQELVVLPTGAGKTIVFSRVIHTLARMHGLNALIIAHRDELLDQAADKYRLVKPDAVVGKVGSGIHQYGGEVTVASIATVSRPEHIKRLRAIGYGIIIVDEAHHVAADGYQRVLAALPDAFVLMVTATPDRLDKKDLLNKKPLYERSILDMVHDGYLCNVRVQAIQTHVSLDEVGSSRGDYNESELDLAINTPARNNLIVRKYQEHASGRRAACFCVTVNHAAAMAYAFNDQGVTAAVVSGETPLGERKLFYEAFRNGRLQVLCTVMVLTEGWDEPLVDCIIMARPTQSRGLFVQCIGRGLRLAPGKADCLILDITDNSFKHRLQPQNLSRALGKEIGDKETLLDIILRDEQEKEERKTTGVNPVVRKLTEKRDQDVQINILERLDWQQTKPGTFVLTVGLLKHRIALVEKQDGLYEVWARLAPDFRGQCWQASQPLDWAQAFAEKRARILLADESKTVLLDKNAAWRSKPIDMDSAQVKKARWHKIEVHEGMTKGELSDKIDAHLEMIAQRKTEREARKREKESVGV